MLRFTFLGSGTSAGVPPIGLRGWEPASARDVRTRTAGCLRWIDPNGNPRTVLLDCGPDIRQQALREDLERCDAILFTHNHVDHTWGLDEVRRFNAVMGAPIDVYAEQRTIEFLHRVYEHIFARHKNVNDSFVASLIEHRIEVGRAVSLYGLVVTPVRLLHGRLPIVGYRIESARDANGRAMVESECLPLAYCTDVSAVPTESWSALAGLQTLVLGALRRRHHPTHFNLDQAVDAASSIGAERTYFVHMNHELVHEETNEELAGLGMRVELAWDGLSI